MATAENCVAGVLPARAIAALRRLVARAGHTHLVKELT